MIVSYRITRLSDECSKVDIDRCNWAYRKNESSAFAYQFAFTPCDGAFVSNTDRIIVLHAALQQGTKLHRRERETVSLLRENTYREEYRAGNTGGFVILTNSISRNPSEADANLFLSPSLCVCVCVFPIVSFFNPARTLMQRFPFPLCEASHPISRFGITCTIFVINGMSLTDVLFFLDFETHVYYCLECMVFFFFFKSY